MATKRITVSLPVQVAARLKRAAGREHSVSEWVAEAVTRSLDEEDLKRRFLEFCDSVKASAAEQRRARAAFDQIVVGRDASRSKKGSRRGKKAA